jgi:hypothetical protein
VGHPGGSSWPSSNRVPFALAAGSAKLLASLGFQALASTSSGYAATLGRLDYSVSREQALAHASALVAATDVPVSADFEDGFAADPAGGLQSQQGPLVLNPKFAQYQRLGELQRPGNRGQGIVGVESRRTSVEAAAGVSV